MRKRDFFLPSPQNGSTHGSGFTHSPSRELLQQMAQKPKSPYVNLIKILEDGTSGLLENSSSDKDFCEEFESISDVVKQALSAANTVALRLSTQELKFALLAAREVSDGIEVLNTSHNGQGVEVLSQVKEKIDAYVEALKTRKDQSRSPG